MRRRVPASALALAGSLGLIGYGAYHLLFVEPGAPVYVPGAMRYTTACVKPDMPIAQSFRVDAAALRAVTLYPASPGSSIPASGQLVVELRAGGEVTGAAAPAPPVATTLQRMSIDAAQLTGRRAFTFELPRPEPAGGRAFTWSMARTAEDGCVAFQASGVNMPDGQMIIGQQVQWGDLLLRAHADRGTILHLFQRWLADRVGVSIPIVVLGALAVVYALAGLWLCRALVVSAPATTASGRA